MSKLVKNNNSNNGRAVIDFIAKKVDAGVTNNVVNNVVSVEKNVRKSVNKYAACNVQRDVDGKITNIDMKKWTTARDRKVSKGDYRFISERYNRSAAKNSLGLDYCY